MYGDAEDTDGIITPQDLGMSWVVSKKKPDFIGKRSFSREENQRGDRKQLVGLLPADEQVLLPEGAQIIATSSIPAPPVPMLGHVTSSYRSDALRRTFALALSRPAWPPGSSTPARNTGEAPDEHQRLRHGWGSRAAYRSS